MTQHFQTPQPSDLFFLTDKDMQYTNNDCLHIHLTDISYRRRKRYGAPTRRVNKTVSYQRMRKKLLARSVELI